MIKKGIVRAKQCGGFVSTVSYYPAAGDLFPVADIDGKSALTRNH